MFRKAAVLVLGALVLAGCGEHAHGHDAEPAAQVVTAQPDVLDFSAETVAGAAFDGSMLTGQKTVFWFWTPGCMDCVREAPHVLDTAEAFRGDVTFVGVAGLGDLAAMNASVKQMKVGGFTQIADADGAVWKRFGVVAQPAYAFVDAAGGVQVVKGALGAKGMKTRVTALAGSGPRK